MRRFLVAAVSILPLYAAVEPGKKIKLSFLPDGSELKNVMFPRYDEVGKLTASLKADVMTLVDDDHIAARGMTIGFFNGDQTSRGVIRLPVALIDQGKGFLKADPPVEMDSERLKISGKSLIYDYSSGEAYLGGPGTMDLLPEKKTAMSRPTISPFRAALMSGVALTSAIAAAEGPAAVPPAGVHAAGAEKTRTTVAADLDASMKAAQAAKNLLERAGTEGDAGPPPMVPPDKPLDPPATSDGSRIEFDGGVYSDMEAGIIVFLKNVRVDDPRFGLTGANDLKVFLTPKDKTKPAPDAKKEPEKTNAIMPGFGGLGGSDVEKIVATGAVHLKQKGTANGKPPVEASGAVFTYHPKSGTMTLSGGFPWVIQGDKYLRAKQANLSVRIEKNGDFHTSGPWEFGGKIDQKTP